MVQVTTVYPTAYFTPAEVTFLSCVSSDQRNLSVASGFGAGAAVSSSSSSSWQPQAHSLDVKTTQSIQHLLALVQSLGAALRFPQRTCSTAQAVLLRLLLHHGANAKRMAGLLLGGGQGVAQEGQQQREALACACIALAGKLNDTNRKMRDVLLGSYKLRFPDLVRRGRVVGAGAGAGAGAGGRASNGTMFRLGNVAEADIDSNALEMERRRLLGLERMLLESVGFEFGASNRVQRTLRYLIKMMRKLGLGVGVGGQSASGSDGGAAAAAAKEARDQASHWQQEQASQHFDFESTAWQVLTDLFRTWHCLQYTPITLAITAIYATALLWQDSVVAVGVQASNGRGDNDDDDDDAVTEGQEQQEARGQRFTSRLVDAKECGCALVRRIRRVVEGLEGQEEQEQEQEQEQEHCEELRRMIRDQLKVHIEDVHEVLHGLLDMYSSSISALTTSTPYTTPATPATPASPSDQLAHLSGNANASSITTHRAGRPTARPQANKSFQTATAAQQVESENHWFRLAREAQADVLGHGQVERRNASGSSGGKEAKNKARSLPKEAVAPPPLGLLALFEKEQSALFVATGTSGARARGHGTNMQAVRGNRTAAGPATSATRGATSVSELLSCIMELKIALREREDERLKRDLRLLGLLGGPLEEKKEDHGASSGRLIDVQMDRAGHESQRTKKRCRSRGGAAVGVGEAASSSRAWEEEEEGAALSLRAAKRRREKSSLCLTMRAFEGCNVRAEEAPKGLKHAAGLDGHDGATAATKREDASRSSNQKDVEFSAGQTTQLPLGSDASANNVQNAQTLSLAAIRQANADADADADTSVQQPALAPPQQQEQDKRNLVTLTRFLF